MVEKLKKAQSMDISNPVGGRRSYTSPNEIAVQIDLEASDSERRGSGGNASEHELMSASFFDEEEANC